MAEQVVEVRGARSRRSGSTCLQMLHYAITRLSGLKIVPEIRSGEKGRDGGKGG